MIYDTLDNPPLDANTIDEIQESQDFEEKEKYQLV